MNAHDSLLDNVASMHEEFSSSNNRMKRAIDEIFASEFKDLEDSLDYFNCEYLVVDKRKLTVIINEFKQKMMNEKIAHVLKYQSVFDKEVEVLKQSMCNFFEKKLIKGDNVKKKMSCSVKDTIDRMCDFNFIGFEEILDTDIYNFKVEFEMRYIHDEYCKDDFNKIIRAFEHSLFENLRSKIAVAVIDKQEIVSRHTMKGYDILNSFKKPMR